MKRKMIIIADSWFNTYQRPHHFAKILSDQYQIDVVGNYVPLPNLARSYSKEQGCLVNKVHKIYLLKGEKFVGISFVNRLLREWQRAKQFKSRVFRDTDIIYTWKVDNVDYLDYCDDKTLIYDAMDDWSAFGAGIDDRLVANEAALAKRADIVLTVSDKIYQKLQGYNKNVHLIRNGVDAAYFKRAVYRTKTKTDDLYEMRDRPVVGYVGHIRSWIDTQLVVEAAKLLEDVEFVVIGPGEYSQIKELAAVDNIHYLGPKPYSSLVDWMSYFSVGIVPFRLNLLNESTNPIKMYEYWGAGLPVVSTSLRDVISYQENGVLYLADDPAGFAEAILRAIEIKNDGEALRKRMALADANSWTSRCKILAEAIESKEGK